MEDCSVRAWLGCEEERRKPVRATHARTHHKHIPRVCVHNSFITRVALESGPPLSMQTVNMEFCTISVRPSAVVSSLRWPRPKEKESRKKRLGSARNSSAAHLCTRRESRACGSSRPRTLASRVPRPGCPTCRCDENHKNEAEEERRRWIG